MVMVYLKLVVFSGRFYISDVSINPSTGMDFFTKLCTEIQIVPPLTQEDLMIMSFFKKVL